MIDVIFHPAVASIWDSSSPKFSRPGPKCQVAAKGQKPIREAYSYTRVYASKSKIFEEKFPNDR
jgi:hypothetical protein